MEKIRKLNLTKQQADLLLITTFFIAAILITVIFKINENNAFHGRIK